MGWWINFANIYIQNCTECADVMERRDDDFGCAIIVSNEIEITV